MEQHKEENEKKKEYLRRYHAAELAEQEIREEIDDLRMNKMFPALIQDGMPHGSSCGDLSAYAVQLDELLIELKDQMEKRIKIRREITEKIEAMQDETEKTVLGTDRRQNGIQHSEHYENPRKGTCSFRNIKRVPFFSYCTYAIV